MTFTSPRACPPPPPCHATPLPTRPMHRLPCPPPRRFLALLVLCSPPPTHPQIQLQQTYTPGVTISMLVQQRPDWEYWLANFNRTADGLLWRVGKGVLRGGARGLRHAYGFSSLSGWGYRQCERCSANQRVPSGGVSRGLLLPPGRRVLHWAWSCVELHAPRVSGHSELQSCEELGAPADSVADGLACIRV